MKNKSPNRLFSALIAVALTTLSVSAASTNTWVGNTDANWGTSGNWTFSSGAGPVASGDSLVLGAAGTSGLALNNNLSGLTLNKLTFNSGADSFTFGGRNITLGTGGIDASALTSGTQTFAFTNVIGTGVQTWNAGAGATLAFGKLAAGAGTADTYGPNGAFVRMSNTGTITTTSVDGWGWRGGAVAGTGLLGPGMVIDNGDNTYDWASAGNSGGTIVPATYTTAVNSDAHNVKVTGNTTVTPNASWASLLVQGATLTHNGANLYLDTGIILENGGVINGSGPIKANNDGLYIHVPDSGTISASIQNNGASAKLLYKAGPGTLTLSGANTYTGNTVVYEGALNQSTAATGAGGYLVKDGATLGVSVVSGGTLKMSSLSLGNCTNAFTGIVTNSAAITNTGALTLAGTVTVNVSGVILSVGQYPLIKSASIGGAGGFVIGSLPAGAVANIVTNGNTIALNVTASQPPSWVWAGGGADNNWSTTVNWTNGTAPDIYDSVVFAGTTQLVNNMDSGYLLGSVTFDATAGSFNITNAANTLTLTGGVTNNSANAQTINVPVSLSTTAPICSASGNLIFGQNIINNGNPVTFAGSGNITLNGMLIGSGGVVKTGAGTVTIRLPFTPPASYSGNTVIQSGTVQLLNDSFRLVTSTFSGAGNLTFANGGGVVGPMLLWGTNNLTGTTTVSNGSLFVAHAPNQSLGSTIRVLDGATFGVLARTDTNYISPASLVIGSSSGATLQFGMTGISEPGLAGTNHAPIQAGTVTINGTATINIANCPFATNSYPLFTGYTSGYVVLGSQPPGYSGKLAVSGSTVYYTVTNLDSHYQPFVHPGCMSTQADIDRMKARIAAGAEPWASGYAVLTNNSHSSASYNANPIPYPTRGGANQNYTSIMNDAAAAYECALRWRISGDTNFAESAMRNMDGYATTVIQLQGDSNTLLMMGAQGFDFACAAELMRDYQPWVDSGGFARFQNFLVYRFYTDAFNGNGIWWFLNAHNGTCWSHYWLNWDGFALSATAAIGVVCDRRDVYNFAVNYYKGSGAGNGMVTNALYFMHPGYLGQSQEMGRDMGHASLDPVLLAEVCEVAWNQGDDLFGYDNNALLAISEMTSRAMTTNPVPWVNYAGCDVNTTTIATGSNYRAGLDMIWNHYVNIKGLSAPYTMASALANRPEGGGGNYGGNSGGFDQIGFTTLTHALDPFTNSPAPSALKADAPLAGTARVWWYGSAYATGHNVKRATSVGGPYSLIATNLTPTDFLYTDTNLTPDTTYYYVVSAIVNGVETTNSLPVSVTANRRLTGTVIGTDAVFINGQWKYQLFDNAPITWFDAYPPSGAWAGLDLGDSYRITKVGYCPRNTYGWRMVGGRFQGCNVPDFSSGVVTLCAVDSAPPEGTNTVQTIANTNGFRYVRYIGPANGYCNASELQFEGVPAPAAAPAPPALQAYLKFDESSGTTAADATGHGWNGTLINGATHVAGYSNNAVNLSGSSQYVTLPSGVVSNLDNFTIAAWVKLNSLTAQGRIFDFGTSTAPGATTGTYMFLTPYNGSNMRFAITTSGYNNEQGINVSALSAGVWTHVAVTLSGNTAVLYVNGVPAGTNSTMTLSPFFLGTTTQNYIGKSQFNDPYFNGQVDDFRIYDDTLNPADVATFVTPLAAPTGLAATAGDGQVALNWSAVANASSYQVLRSLSNGGPYTQIASVATTGYTDSTVLNGKKYYYVVKAANAVGISANSAQVSARPVSMTQPAASATVVGNQLQLNWPADHTGWRLLMSTNLAGTNWLEVSDANATNMMFIPATNGSMFYRLVYP